ncbi:MAG: DNA mismatch repair protein MutS, partial [Candidatus Dojkabacteria bacterium]|nr:DNA mismatch repair protein MutS [Candidatus Dojkabacteria bacterium]
KDSEIIKHYHDSVEFFFDNMLLNCNIRDTLKNIIDLERIVSKLGLNTINPKEIYYLKLSLNKIFDVHKYIQDQQAIPTYLKTLLDKIQNKLPDVLKIVNKINEYLRDDPPTEVGFGYVIKTGVSKDLDNFIELKNNSKEYLLKIQQIEIEKTGIASLKIGFNQVFGYYLEVTKSNLNKVPPYYIRKQTLANVERFITPELKELEEKILSVDIQIKELEQKLFDNLCKFLLQYIDTVMYLADIISELDLITNFAFIAKENDYVKPIIHSRMNMIENGRHPVIEKLQKEYVPNNTNFTKPIHIITGPNMAGKSTYIRAVCLIYIMAQIGSFVPATKFVFTPVDNVFSRIGAADNLSKGESTFMVEMIETANILNNATRNSLIILDEIGRGTSTYDGVAIAWSIIEYICNNLQTKTLFATHYHELTNLEKKFSELVENYHVKVANLDNKNIKFLYKLDRGFTNKSYGIYVAKMAGIPELVIKRAEEILSLFEKNNNVSNVTKNDIVKDVIDIKPKKVDVEQLTLM